MFERALWIVLYMVLRLQFSLTCPRQCRCPSRDPAKGLFVKCEGSGFREISLSPDSLRNVSVLNLRNNQITSVPTKAFGMQRSLKKL
ncbi:hypothetical protein AC249_AIPGENE13269 [Exaiptasia diaphana]|nr:hypothetical protein AC249_AIPGENE13269 [Exaiptasia diaphana]